MGKQKYEFDSSTFSFKEASMTTVRIVKGLLRLFLLSLALVLIVYAVLSLIISTDTEKIYHKENRIYEKEYKTMLEKESLLADVISGLQVKDNSIYTELFNSPAPDLNPMNSLDFLYGNDTIRDSKIIKYTFEKTDRLYDSIVVLEGKFEKLYKALARRNGSLPPMHSPIKDLKYSQIGASIGNKTSPFLKATIYHKGLDIIASQGCPVFAPADGTVADVKRSSKGNGNVIEIVHAGGYMTRYAHLASFAVRKGQVVRRGDKIGAVGMSGAAFAPHLHYEVWRNGICCDPVSFLFADVKPGSYADMLYMAASTKQSMD